MRGVVEARVTSLEATKDGRWILAGCADGTVRLFPNAETDQHEWGESGLVLEQIHPRGLITHLSLNVKVTDDGQWAFAGVLRGATELLAINLTRLSSCAAPADVEEKVPVTSKLDPKLRGFGAVARVASSDEYVIVVGLGFRTCHLWRFHPTGGQHGAPAWTWLLDKQTNGNSIEILGLRHGGKEIISKSSGQNVRVWDTASKDGPPSFKDIHNTQDARAFLSDFVVGGSETLSLVDINAEAAHNRTELALPQRRAPTGEGGNQPRKRQLNVCEEVVASASKVLIACSDGSVFCCDLAAEMSVVAILGGGSEAVMYSITDVVVGPRVETLLLRTWWDLRRSVITAQPLQLRPLDKPSTRARVLADIDTNRPPRVSVAKPKDARPSRTTPAPPRPAVPLPPPTATLLGRPHHMPPLSRHVRDPCEPALDEDTSVRDRNRGNRRTLSRAACHAVSYPETRERHSSELRSTMARFQLEQNWLHERFVAERERVLCTSRRLPLKKRRRAAMPSTELLSALVSTYRPIERSMLRRHQLEIDSLLASHNFELPTAAPPVTVVSEHEYDVGRFEALGSGTSTQQGNI